MRLVSHVALKGEMRNVYIILDGRDHLEDTDRDGKISEWILEKEGGRIWTGFIWLRIGASGGLL
jgi:hypothetical protein